MLLKSRSPAGDLRQQESSVVPRSLPASASRAACGGAMTLLAPGRGAGRYRYYTCCNAKARQQGETGLSGSHRPDGKTLIILSRSTSSSVCCSPSVLSNYCRTVYSIAAPSAPMRRKLHIAELRKSGGRGRRQTQKRLYFSDAIENGIV